MADIESPLMTGAQQEPERTTAQRIGNFVGSTLFTAALGAVTGAVAGIATDAVQKGIDGARDAAAAAEPELVPPSTLSSIGTGLSAATNSLGQGSFWNEAVPDIKQGAAIGGGIGAGLGALKSMVVGKHTARVMQERELARGQDGPTPT